MKIAPVSADLLIKVALVAVSLGALWYILNRATGATAAAAAWVGETADNVVQAVNPLSTENVFYTGANAITGGTPDESIGTRIYDYFHPEPPVNTGGATGSW